MCSQYGDDAVSEMADDDPRCDALRRSDGMVARAIERLAARRGGTRGTAGDEGSWRVTRVDGIDTILWRTAWARRDQVLPAGVLAWAADRLPSIIRELRENA